MWLCDSLPTELPGAQIIIYGYDTKVAVSQSFQDLEALASTLRSSLQILTAKQVSETKDIKRPLIFICQSLGGLIFKEAVIQMKDDERSHSLLGSIYGALFFGVPNQGLDNASLIQMAQDGPNVDLIRSMGKQSMSLRNQARNFPKVFDHQDSEIVCFYETMKSSTAVQVSK